MNTLAPSFLIRRMIILILAGDKDMHESLDESNFGQIPTPTPEISALARLKNCCIMLCPL